MLQPQTEPCCDTQASVALVTCSWVSSLLDKAAQILTDPVDRLAAHYSLILDLSMDPATCPAAYAGMGWVQCEDEKACLRNWLIQEQSAPEAAARLQQRIAEEQETERFQREAIAKMEGQCNQQSSQEDVDMEDGSSYATDEESTNDSCGAFDEDDRQHASDQHGGRMDTGEYDMEVDSSTDSPTEEDDSSNEGCSRNNGGAGASSSDNSQQDSGAHAYPDFGQDADSAADQQGNPGCEAQDGYVPADTAHYQDHNKDEEDALLHECFQPMDDM